MQIDEKKLFTTKYGEDIKSYTLTNSYMQVEILNYGGIIRKILVPNRKGELENVVLGFSDITAYEKNSPYFGAIIGRNAGRIEKGVLKIEGKTYYLDKNSGENNLHSGSNSFSHKVWGVNKIIKDDFLALELSLKSSNLENGFPGNVDIKVIYTLKSNEFTLEYYGNTDIPTYLNMTNHTYFNLSGDFKSDILCDELMIDSNEFIAVSKETLPFEIRKCEDTVFDFRNLKNLAGVLLSSEEQIKMVNQGLDHPFILDNSDKIKIVLKNRCSGRVLSIKTNQPSVVVYSGNYLDEVTEASPIDKIKKYMGICFETQDFPNVLNFMPKKSKITTINNPYYQKTKFIFTYE